MAGVIEHYENHLAGVYSWLYGGLESKIEENRQFFELYGILPHGSGRAVDLGAGSGFQSIPLAQLGFSLTAMDISEKLLNELRENSAGFSITLIQDDITQFQKYFPEEIELCVCMGDTLTHLVSKAVIRQLFSEVFASLEKNGRFVLTFRDLTYELKELDRFIPLRSDENTVFTCFLEYEEETVKVHDLIYQKVGESWHLSKSFYRKTRIPFDWAKQELEERGFTLELAENEKGLITIIVRK